MDLVTTGCAVYSACDRYRYVLGREWNGNLRTGVFVMLNPSTATAGQDDRTIARCVTFARQLNWGRLLVLNLFAFISPDPRQLRAPGVRPNGAHNERAWTATLNGPAAGAPVICAWGNEAVKVPLEGTRCMFAELALQYGWRLQELWMTGKAQPAHVLAEQYGGQPVPLDARRLL